MSGKLRTYVVVYELDERGWWVASVPEVPGCHTQGRSIAQARERVREALGLFRKGAGRVRFEEDVRLPAQARRLITELERARQKAEAAHDLEQELVRKVAAFVTGRVGLSLRDTGELLGLSHQRVQQVVQREGRRAP